MTRVASFARFIAWAIFGTRIVLFDLLEILRAKSVNDYGTFHTAAFALSEGLDPYKNADLQRAAREVGLGGAHPYFYPPFLAELLVPLSFLDLFPARMVWEVITITCFGASMFLLDRHVASQFAVGDAEQEAAREHARTAFAIAMCAFWPIRAAQWMGQVNPVILLLIVAWWVHRERRWAPALLGVAIAIKMSPALLLLVPLVEKKFREALVAAATGAVLIVGSCLAIGGRGTGFLRDVVLQFVPGRRWHELSIPIGLHGNHSLGGFAFRLLDMGRGTDGLRLSPRAALLHIALIITLLGLWAWRAPKISSDAKLAALVVVMIVAPTFAFEHHVSFAALPIALLAALSLRGTVPRALVLASTLAIALLTEHEGSFALWARPWERGAIIFSAGPKLFLLLIVFAAALASHAPIPTRETPAAR